MARYVMRFECRLYELAFKASKLDANKVWEVLAREGRAPERSVALEYGEGFTTVHVDGEYLGYIR